MIIISSIAETLFDTIIHVFKRSRTVPWTNLVLNNQPSVQDLFLQLMHKDVIQLDESAQLSDKLKNQKYHITKSVVADKYLTKGKTK